MRAYLSKYALTEGVVAVEGEPVERGADIFRYRREGRPFEQYAHGSEWHLDLASALFDAEKRRVKKIRSLKQQIAKLEGKSFEPAGQS